jgi:hypothetical protein
MGSNTGCEGPASVPSSHVEGHVTVMTYLPPNAPDSLKRMLIARGQLPAEALEPSEPRTAAGLLRERRRRREAAHQRVQKKRYPYADE